MKADFPNLSKAELDILNILWKKNPLSVREVHDALGNAQGWAYTTTKTTMDRMAHKNLLKRVEFHRIFIYEPLISRPKGLLKWITYFAEKVLETDSASVVPMFGKQKNLSREEISELYELIEQYKENHYD
jgi:predicted transcriptional regulator